MWQYNYAANSDELYHYGIPGMRWGQRKAAGTTNYEKISKKGQAVAAAKARLKTSNKDDGSYDVAKAKYKKAKQEYQAEKGKTNEKYKHPGKDMMLLGPLGKMAVNNTLNKNKDMSVAEARKSVNNKVGAAIVGTLLGYAVANTVTKKVTGKSLTARIKPGIRGLTIR